MNEIKTPTRERIIALKEILEKNIYQNNGISMNEIRCELRNFYELCANRKTIYKDIEMINESFDLNVSYNNKLKKYMIKDKKKIRIEDIEVITNALISSKFISEKNTRQLIRKLHIKLGYKKQNIIGLDHNRIKIENEEFYEVINTIDKAIKENRKVKFDYYKPNSLMKPICAIPNCNVSPIAHVWYEDLYYILGNYEKSKISHYRIDRIKNIEMTKIKRKPIYEIIGKHNDFNISEYVSKLAGMSSGKEIAIRLRVKNKVIGRIYDKFGNKIQIINTCDDYSDMRISVINNKDLLMWLLMFGDEIEVLSPKNIRKEIVDTIKDMNLMYKNN